MPFSLADFGLNSYNNLQMTEEKATSYNTKAVRVADRLAADIRQGKYESGVILPAEATLAKTYDVSRETMRKSLAILARTEEILKLPQGGSIIPMDVQPGPHDQQTERNLAVAVVWASIPNGHVVEICEGIEKYAREHNDINIRFFFPSQGHEEAIDILNNARDSLWDGIIVHPYVDDNYVQAIENLANKGFPIVCVDRRIDNVAASSVGVYNVSGMYRATRYLIDKFRRPVYILAGKMEQRTILDRFEGYCHAMADAGFDRLIKEHTFESAISENDPQYWPVEKKWLPGYLLAKEFLDTIRTFPVSVVCTNDNGARGFYEAAHERGLVIGKDIAIASFDDLPLAAMLTPPLTTVHQPRLQVGYEAAALLHRLITKKEKPPQHIYLPVELVVRESA